MQASAVVAWTGGLYPLIKPCPAPNFTFSLFWCHITNICTSLLISHTECVTSSVFPFIFQLQDDTNHLIAVNWYFYDKFYQDLEGIYPTWHCGTKHITHVSVGILWCCDIGPMLASICSLSSQHKILASSKRTWTKRAVLGGRVRHFAVRSVVGAPSGRSYLWQIVECPLEGVGIIEAGGVVGYQSWARGAASRWYTRLQYVIVMFIWAYPSNNLQPTQWWWRKYEQ